jgi:hypothetical protein
MKVSVWDTYVTRKDGRVMHFDIIVPAELKSDQTIFRFGKDYLQSKNESGQDLASNECRFCHIEEATEKMIESINQKGYYIVEMQNCN